MTSHLVLCNFNHENFCRGHASSLPKVQLELDDRIIYLKQKIYFFLFLEIMEDRLERFEAKLNLSFNRLNSKIDSQQASIDYLTTLVERIAEQVFCHKMFFEMFLIYCLDNFIIVGLTGQFFYFGPGKLFSGKS